MFGSHISANPGSSMWFMLPSNMSVPCVWGQAGGGTTTVSVVFQNQTTAMLQLKIQQCSVHVDFTALTGSGGIREQRRTDDAVLERSSRQHAPTSCLFETFSVLLFTLCVQFEKPCWRCCFQMCAFQLVNNTDVVNIKQSSWSNKATLVYLMYLS